MGQHSSPAHSAISIGWTWLLIFDGKMETSYPLIFGMFINPILITKLMIKYIGIVWEKNVNVD